MSLKYEYRIVKIKLKVMKEIRMARKINKFSTGI